MPLERKSILKLVAAARAGSSRVRVSAMLPVYSGEVYSGYSGEVYARCTALVWIIMLFIISRPGFVCHYTQVSHS